MHETNEYRLKADYIRKTLETERANREQADIQVVDLLHDIKSRYEIKLNSYMAKNKNKKREEKTTSAAADAWAASTTDNQQSGGGWGDTNNDTAQQTFSWDNTTDNNQSTQTENWDKNATNVGRGTSTGDQQNGDGGSGNNNDTAQQNQQTESWDLPNDNNQSSQQTESWDLPADSKNNDTNDNKKQDSNGKKTSPDKVNPSKAGPGKNNKSKESADPKAAEKNSNNNTNCNDSKKQDANSKKATPKKASPSKDNSAKTNNKSDGWSKESDEPKSGEKGETASKEYLDMKSQLLSARLDLRLLERDKAKLNEEVSELKTERDNLMRKLEHATQDLERLQLKVRGTTVDLVAANEEIHKLNGRIDEIEGERRNRDNDINIGESRRRAMENKYKMYHQQIADLQSELNLLKEERDEYKLRSQEVGKRNERLEADLKHSKKLIGTLKEGCAFVESQAKTFEVRHDTVVMSKADLERELIAIKEESSRHITTINKLQKSCEQISKAFIQSVEAHDQCKKESDAMQQEFNRRLHAAGIENHRLVEANSQLHKLVDYLQRDKKRG